MKRRLFSAISLMLALIMCFSTATYAQTNEETVDITGEIIFEDDISAEEVTIQLYLGFDVIDNAVVSEDTGWTFAFTDLAKYDESENANMYDVMIDDSSMEEDWMAEVSVTEGYYTFTISLDDEDDSFGPVLGEVKFDLGEETLPESVTVELYYDNAEDEDWLYDNTTVTADDEWTFWFEDVLLLDIDGNPVPYYAVLTSEDVKDGWVITNGTADNDYVITVTAKTDDSNGNNNDNSGDNTGNNTGTVTPTPENSDKITDTETSDKSETGTNDTANMDSAESDSTAPKTGDMSYAGMWMATAILAVTAVILSAKKKSAF